MHKIVTITFSPCIDKSTSVSLLAPDIKMRCTLPIVEPGGGGINVARAIKKLGGEATAIYTYGGYTGRYFNQLMEDENIASVKFESANETRENITLLDESTNNQYRLGMPLPALTAMEWTQFLSTVEQIMKCDYIVASGSLPPGVPLTIYASIAEIAMRKKAKFIVDTAGEPLQHAIEAGVYLIKPNLGELSTLVGKKELLPNEIVDVARAVVTKNKCEVVVVSMGPEGAMLVTSDFAQHIKPPEVIRKSTVGAGDSMVAGMVYHLSLGKTPIESVHYGVACGTAATMNPGTQLCRKEDADMLLTQLELTDL